VYHGVRRVIGGRLVTFLGTAPPAPAPTAPRRGAGFRIRFGLIAGFGFRGRVIARGRLVPGGCTVIWLLAGVVFVVVGAALGPAAAAPATAAPAALFAG
jgi:hypothetical protein